VRETHREYREECRHDHEQTYEDYNSEQRSYDAQNRLEDQFARKLQPNEQIIWCAKPEPNLTSEESGAGCAKGAGVMMIAAGLPLLIVPLFGIFMIVIGAFLIKGSNVRSRSYAITTSRLMILDNGRFRSIPLSGISNITFKSSARNIGYVTFMKQTMGQTANQRGLTSDGIFGVKDPAGVSRILKDAIHSQYRNQGVRK
jgi:hypothetical protein